MLGCIIYALLLSPHSTYKAQNKINKRQTNQNTSKISNFDYQKGLQALASGEDKKAKTYFEKVANANGGDSDSARVELLRLMATESNSNKQSNLKVIYNLLDSFTDNKLQSFAWIITLRSLYLNSRLDDALLVSAQIKNRYVTKADIASEALLIAARIYYYQYNQAHLALSQSYEAIKKYPKNRVLLNIYNLLADIYSANGAFQNLSRACDFSEKAKEQQQRLNNEQSHSLYLMLKPKKKTNLICDL